MTHQYHRERPRGVYWGGTFLGFVIPMTVVLVLLASAIGLIVYGVWFEPEYAPRAGVNPTQLRCEEDEVIQGVGNFDGDVWDAYRCIALDNLTGGN